ncbi:MAG: ABC transporter ATP-binding protein [Synechococcaceae cyanobacterium SM2_3_2]|nr:ABC transporter ATP-binding protein [Synechococcaceae cyanobacterium SM2_3_2]
MIEVEHLSKVYGTFRAIQDVSFRVEPGEIMGFLGPNGAGKTTSMRILSGYLPATTGTVRVAGFDVISDSMSVRKKIGYLPENPPLYPDMTVENYLSFVAQLKKVAAGRRAEQVNRAIERCSLQEKRDVLIRKLSKGFKQRVGIAQAIVHDPPVIILDEPTVGLDPKQIIEVRNLIKSLAGDHTIILSTHILPEVSMTCDRVVIINRGKVAASGKPGELTQQVGSQVQLQVEGSPDDIRGLLASLQVAQLLSLEPLSPELPDRWVMTLQSQIEGDRWVRDVAATLVHGGIGIYELRRSQATLEDIFLQLTTQEGSLEESGEPEEGSPSSTTVEANRVESNSEAA